MRYTYYKNSIIIYFFCAVFFTLCSHAATQQKIPRFVSIKSNEINLRSGPGSSYAISMTYKFKHYPLEVIAEFENWRLVRDDIGNKGWVHQNLLSAARYAIILKNVIYDKQLKSQFIKKNEALLFRLPDEASYPILRMEFGVVVAVKKCIEKWCKVQLSGKVGWIPKVNLWGVYSDEIIGK